MEALNVHSLNEAYLYLMVTHCASCGDGPLHGEGGQIVDSLESKESYKKIEVKAACRSCFDIQTYTFLIPVDQAQVDADQPNRINATAQPSQLIDVASWITLYQMLCESAKQESNKTKMRNFRIEAGYCLEEALKFYSDQNDLPPETALFLDSSRERLRNNPEQFSRTRLINLLAALPSPSTG